MNMMSKMKYNVPVCEWNELFGKIPGEGAFGMSFSEEKCSKLKCSKSLQQLQKKSSPSHMQKNTVTWWKAESIQTLLHTLFELEQVVEGFYNGISTAEVDTLAAETCAYMYLDLSWDLWMDPMNSCPVNQWILWDLNREYHFWILNPIESPKRLSQ